MNYTEFDNKYRKDWNNGNISKESIDDLSAILQNISIDHNIYCDISYRVHNMIVLLIKYRYANNQSIHWIEPIRENNLALHSWVRVDPDVVNYGYEEDMIAGDIGFGFMYTYGYNDWYERTGEELISKLTKEFNINNLASIDYIEQYLRNYAKTSKIKRYLQIL